MSLLKSLNSEESQYKKIGNYSSTPLNETPVFENVVMLMWNRYTFCCKSEAILKQGVINRGITVLKVGILNLG